MWYELINKFDIARSACYNELEKYVPDNIYSPYFESYQKVKNCIRANKISKTSLTTENIPKHIMNDFLASQESIINYVKENELLQKNKLSKYYLKATVLENYFDRQRLNISDPSCNTRITYKFLSQKTLRADHKENSFRIMNFPKEKRNIILPHNDFFVELDYNSADLRSVFACLGIKQPTIDIYQHIKDLYKINYERQELKIKTLAWLHSGDYFGELETLFQRENLLKQYYKNGILTNLFGFEIPCEEKKAVGYLAQSTTSIIFLDNLYNILKYIYQKKLKTKISLCIHDSVLLDVSKEEKEEIYKIKQIYKETKFGEFLVRTKVGKNYGDMK